VGSKRWPHSWRGGGGYRCKQRNGTTEEIKKEEKRKEQAPFRYAERHSRREVRTASGDQHEGGRVGSFGGSAAVLTREKHWALHVLRRKSS